MNTPVASMNRCAVLAHVPGESTRRELLAALENPEWPVRLAAIVALGDRRDPETLEDLLRMLETESTAPLYSQPGELAAVGAAQVSAAAPIFPSGTTGVMIAAWERRGRLKQAACLALASLGIANPRIIAALGNCATTAYDDYPVRAAAAKALGLLGDSSALPYLERAADDEEWCTRTEARKALAMLSQK